ncbi:MAG: 50S ribosomal protein L6 [Candidatus Yanofskybacteria bacterium]|nr:50S ribosomal protein L6 [Candidatus Yanofskybacteria bacterium]
MSRIGKKPIKLPSGVELTVEDSTVTAKGPKGELKREIPSVLEVKAGEGEVRVGPRGDMALNKFPMNLWGLGWALVNSMVKGVSDGFTKSLEFNGVGFKAQVKGNDLELNLGYTHPVIVHGSSDVSFQVEKGTITVSGLDKELVGHIAAQIRNARPPEPYKGTGIKYKGEVIRRKAGKKAVTTG